MATRSSSSLVKPARSGNSVIAPETPKYKKMLSVLRQFRVIIASIKEHYREIEIETGVSGAQLWALNAIAKCPNMSVSQLARELGIHQSTASNLIVRLIELGHIERKRENKDLRVVTIQLTKTGKRTVASAPRPAIGMLQQALLTLPDDRLGNLHADLDALIKTIGLRSTGIATPLSTSLGKSK